MAFGVRHSRALVLGASAFSFALMASGAAFTQALETETVTRTSEQKKQKQAKRQQAKPQQSRAGRGAGHEREGADRRAPVQSLDTITVAASKTEERAIDALAPVSVGDAGADPGPAAEPAVGYLLQRARRVVPGARRRSRDRRSTSAACRISAASRSSSTARGRTISAPATTPTARSSSIPSWSAASMSCAARPPTSTAPARSAAWSRSAPRTSTTSCARASAGAST